MRPPLLPRPYCYPPRSPIISSIVHLGKRLSERNGYEISATRAMLSPCPVQMTKSLTPRRMSNLSFTYAPKLIAHFSIGSKR